MLNSRLSRLSVIALVALIAGLSTGCHDNKKDKPTSQRIERKTDSTAGRIETERTEIQTMGEPDDPKDLDDNPKTIIETDRVIR